MNGAHDMGGAHGFGPVVPEPDEPVFHAEWERRVFGSTLAAAALGEWNIDSSRFARENTPPGDYLDRSYYEMWLFGLEQLVVARGLVSAEELASARDPDARFDRVQEPPLMADAVAPMLAAGNSAHRAEGKQLRFSVGDAVRVLVATPSGHTRAPRYVRGRTGLIDRVHGNYVFADTNAHGRGEHPQPVYSVRFEATELWGTDAQGGAVYVDLWDDHLEAVTP